MAQFKFKLHAVLRQRELIEQNYQRDLAVATGDLVAAETELKRLDDTVQAAVADLRQNQLVGKINLSFLAAHRRFMLAMQRQGVLQVEKVNAAQKKVDFERGKLAEAAKQRKIIEKLREHQQAIWTDAMNQKENAAMDEIAMQLTSEAIRDEWFAKVAAESSESEHRP